MTWTLCTSGSAITKAGTHANATLIASGSLLADFSNEVEAELVTVMRSNIVGNYGSLTASGKAIFEHLSSCMIAQHIISYDMSGYIPFGEAITILNVLENQIGRELQLVHDDKYATFLGVVSSS